jgi:predicted AlkP superfamily phosphohydrolase/phosphomutase
MYYDDDPGLRKIYGDRPFEQVVPNAYKVIDGMLGDILKYVDENTVVILVSDHGFETFHLPDGAAVCDHSRAPDGVIIASGPYIQMRKQRISEYSVYDITPTILTLFGLPVGKDMDGKVMEDILDPQFLKDNPVAYIKSHNRGFIWRKYSTESTEDRTMLEKFRALGYIK